ncbi:gamma carbonic anhydrase family protein [bacterium]|nr:gamma carbonic anhydrase family protein [bacterium]
MIIKPYNNIHPRIADDVFVAPGAVVVGDVEIAEGASVWYNTVIRGDVGQVRIGARTNIQDLCMLHMSTGISNCIIGEDCTIGHRVVLHGCILEDRVMVGMGAVVLDNAKVGRGSVIAAGAVVLANMEIPPGSLVTGVPAEIKNTKEGKERFDAPATSYLYTTHSAHHKALYHADEVAREK